MPIISLVDAVCGSGKTYAALRYVVDRCRRNRAKFLIVLPSRLLIDQVHQDLEALLANGKLTSRIPLSQFDSETDPGRVRSALMEHFKHTRNGPEIVLCTHAAFIGLRHFHQRQRWHILIDEVPKVFDSHRMRIPRNHKLITALIEPDEPLGEKPIQPSMTDVVRRLGLPANPEQIRIPVTLWERLEKGVIHLEKCEYAWSEWVQFVRDSSHEPPADKVNKIAFTPAHFSGERRKRQDATISGMICLDSDSGLSLQEAFGIIRASRLECLVYTTKRHSPAQHRFRICFPLPSEIEASLMPAICTTLNELFGGTTDLKPNPEDLFDLPSGVEGNPTPVWHLRGRVLRPLDWTNLIPPVKEPRYVRLLIADEGGLEGIRQNKLQDDVDRLFQPLADAVTNPHLRCEILADQYRCLLSNEALSAESDGTDDPEVGQLELFTQLMPSVLDGFASVTIMAANIQNSLMYLSWSQFDEVTFQPHPRIGLGPYRFRFNDHSGVGSRLTIRTTSSGSFSKKWRDRNDHMALTLAMIEQWIEPGQEYIYVVNNDQPDLRGGTRLGHSPHGLNQYDRIHTGVFLSAQNPTPSFQKWLGARAPGSGITPAQIKASRSFETLYQFAMRTSLRDPDSEARVSIIVADGESAFFLESMFPGCQIELHQAVPVELTPKAVGRPRKPNAKAERQKRYRDRKKAERAEAEALSDEVARIRSAGEQMEAIARILDRFRQLNRNPPLGVYPTN